MSTALGIAAVTAVLESLLNSIYTNANLGQVKVSAVAPDLVTTASTNGAAAPLQVNLFLHQVTPNAAWRNVGLPSLSADGAIALANPPLALDLHYLLTAYATEDCQAEALLGYAVQLLHENPVLPRNQIQSCLNHQPNVAPLSLLAASGLASQIEMIKITPAPLGREEMAWLWTALKADYRPTFPFQASVVLIQSQNPLLSALPVLQRTVNAQASVMAPGPSLTAIIPPNHQPAAKAGDNVTVQGINLTGATSVVLSNARLMTGPISLTPGAGTDSSLQFTIPNPPPPPVTHPPTAPTDLPAGIYLVSVQVGTGSDAVATNSLPLAMAPTMTKPPASPIKRDVHGNAKVAITCAPFLRPQQEVSLLIGSTAAPADPFTVPINSPSFSFTALPATSQSVPVRLRVDGVDSAIIDMTKTPPVFTGTLVQVQ